MTCLDYNLASRGSLTPVLVCKIYMYDQEELEQETLWSPGYKSSHLKKQHGSEKNVIQYLTWD